MNQHDIGPDAVMDTDGGGAVFEREDVTFASGEGTCAGWLYRPAVGAASPPVIVMAHGFGATRELRLHAYAERFAAAGYAVVVFDYRSFGDSPGEPRRLLRITHQHQDWRAALEFARGHEDLDGRRLVAWGTSLSGGHVLHLAARDSALAAIVVQVPHISGPASSLSGGIGHGLRLGAIAVGDLLRTLAGRPPRYVTTLGDPGEPAAMTTAGSRAVLRDLAGPGRELYAQQENSVCARSILQMPWYSPGRGTGRIAVPALVQIAEHDALTPPSVARRAAERIPRVRIESYPCGHFDPYLPPLFDGVISDQLDFLTSVVPVHPR